MYIKPSQVAYINRIKERVNGEEILLQVDFSENATLSNQNEIQTAHWNHDQATLFTAHAWITSDPATIESIVMYQMRCSNTSIGSIHLWSIS